MIVIRWEPFWGVIQTCFGDRVRLLLGLFDRTFARLYESVSGIELVPAKSEDRGKMLTDAMSIPDCRILVDIQSELRRDSMHRADVGRLSPEIRAPIREMWRKTLSEIPTTEVDRAVRLATLGIQAIAMG